MSLIDYCKIFTHSLEMSNYKIFILISGWLILFMGYITKRFSFEMIHALKHVEKYDYK